jgi:hypothetical protein
MGGGETPQYHAVAEAVTDTRAHSLWPPVFQDTSGKMSPTDGRIPFLDDHSTFMNKLEVQNACQEKKKKKKLPF